MATRVELPNMTRDCMRASGEADPRAKVSTGKYRNREAGFLAVPDGSVKSFQRLKAEKMLLDQEEP